KLAIGGPAHGHFRKIRFDDHILRAGSVRSFHVQPPLAVASGTERDPASVAGPNRTRVVFSDIKRQPLHPARVKEPTITAFAFVLVDRKTSSVRSNIDSGI